MPADRPEAVTPEASWESCSAEWEGPSGEVAGSVDRRELPVGAHGRLRLYGLR